MLYFRRGRNTNGVPSTNSLGFISPECFQPFQSSSSRWLIGMWCIKQIYMNVFPPIKEVSRCIINKFISPLNLPLGWSVIVKFYNNLVNVNFELFESNMHAIVGKNIRDACSIAYIFKVCCSGQVVVRKWSGSSPAVPQTATQA